MAGVRGGSLAAQFAWLPTDRLDPSPARSRDYPPFIEVRRTGNKRWLSFVNRHAVPEPI
jgi:hypothetical protein